MKNVSFLYANQQIILNFSQLVAVLHHKAGVAKPKKTKINYD